LDELTYLFSLEQFGIKFGLENIGALVESLGHPERAFKVVHIAGTNGKGSVTAIVDAALRAGGRRSARFTSPHLVDLTERFVIDGTPVSTASLVETVAAVRVQIDDLLTAGALQAQPTFFEVTTAAALELFRRAKVEVAVVEVGLGGRLDATNIVTPAVTAITSISFDHQQYLGSTLSDIAHEKAGIIKPGVPVVVGRVGTDAADVIAQVATERDAKVVMAHDGVTATPVMPDRVLLRTPAHDYGSVHLGLRGAHQIDNAVVAVRVLEILGTRGVTVESTSIVDALAHVTWPGRLDLRRLPDGREAMLDAAHNPAGAAALASYLREGPEALPLVFAAMRDKDVDEMLCQLLPAVSALVLTRASNPRSADPTVLADRARIAAPSLSIEVESNVTAALAAAWRRSPRIVVAGSIYLLGDVMKEIGGP
jgi:dihydrofolate synthase/folylpolyglutamate synthase